MKNKKTVIPAVGSSCRLITVFYLYLILVVMTSCSQTCMMKTTRCFARPALSHRSNHSESTRFARKARAKRLLPHVWTLAKCAQASVQAHACARLAHCFHHTSLPDRIAAAPPCPAAPLSLGLSGICCPGTIVLPSPRAGSGRCGLFIRRLFSW